MTEPRETPDGVPEPGERANRYVRVAMERHWDPAEIDLAPDTEAVSELSRVEFTRLRGLLAQFGAGEQSVLDDLVPLSQALDDPDDRRFVATQLFDETRHAEFFDRYWDRVVRPEERARGTTPTDPTDDRWHSGAYGELFDRTAEAMGRLRETDAPEAMARAYVHYHLTTEGILATTAYDWVERRYEGGTSVVPALPGLAEGFYHLRVDEGRHVGFGTTKLRELVESGAVDPGLVSGTLDELVPLVEEVNGRMVRDGDAGIDRKGMVDRIRTTKRQRLSQVGALEEQ